MPSPLLLRDKARQCLEIAEGVSDGQIVAVLHKVAAWFEAQARTASASAVDTAPRPPVAAHEAKPRIAARKAVSITATLRRQGGNPGSRPMSRTCRNRASAWNRTTRSRWARRSG